MTLKLQFRRPTMLAAALTLLAGISLSAFGASPARADRCDGITAANVIYLSHPQARELTLGCRGRNYSNELYAKADSRKPKPYFFDTAATAAALVFTIPKPDALTGSTRCIKRMGLFRGDNVKMRYRRLDMECTRTKTEAAIAISRGRDE